jgi:hypothetical protein
MRRNSDGLTYSFVRSSLPLLLSSSPRGSSLSQQFSPSLSSLACTLSLEPVGLSILNVSANTPASVDLGGESLSIQVGSVFSDLLVIECVHFLVVIVYVVCSVILIKAEEEVSGQLLGKTTLVVLLIFLFLCIRVGKHLSVGFMRFRGG